MCAMKTKITKLIEEYQKYNKISTKANENFIDYCLLFMKNSACNFSIKKLESEIAKKGVSAQKKYNELTKITETEYKVIKSLILISNLRKTKREKVAKESTNSATSQINILKYIKKGALGFKIGVFDDYTIYKSKDYVEPHIYEILFNIYQIANIYKKLKNNSTYVSKAQMNFYFIVEKIIKAYENKVIEQDINITNNPNIMCHTHNTNYGIFSTNNECCNINKTGTTSHYNFAILKFYLNLYKNILDLQYINQINECFLENPKNPYSTLKKLYQGIEEAKIRYEISNIEQVNDQHAKEQHTGEHKSHTHIYHEHNIDQQNSNVNTYANKQYSGDSTNFYSINSIERIVAGHLNTMTNQLINTGNFVDIENEYFITKNKKIIDLWDVYTIDYGLIPYFIKESDAVKINYIGKSMYILNKTKKYETNYKINIFVELKILDVIIENVNEKMREVLSGVKENLETVKNIFLFQRSDFVETLSMFLNRHENKNLFNRTISYILENAMVNTFGRLNEFMKKIDVCILENEQSLNCISLFCQLNFPLNLIFTKEIILKLVGIFKFLWRVKKIENLIAQLRKKEIETNSKVKIIVYNNLINKLMFYFCYEVIEKEFVIENVKQDNVKEYNVKEDNVKEGHKKEYNAKDVTAKQNIITYKIESSNADICNEYQYSSKYQQNKSTNSGMIVDDMRQKINEMLDEIIKHTFQCPKNGKKDFDIFLASIETLLMLVGRTHVTSFTDDDVKKNLSVFVAKNEHLLKNTTLHDLGKFV
ncbi:Gamma-tubulin complex component 3 [Binucleata daphniae]